MIKLLFNFLIIINLRLVENQQEIQEFRIGGLFQEDLHEMAFRVATNLVNERYSNTTNFRLIPETANVNSANTFNVYDKAFDLLKRGIKGLFGPSSQFSSSYIQTVCDQKEIPHIETHWDPNLKRNDSLVNLYPYPDTFSNVFLDLIVSWGWRRVMVLYENHQSLAKISRLLSLNNLDNGYKITLQLLERDSQLNYRPMLIKIRKTGQTHFIIDCSIEILKELLNEVQEVGLMTEKYNYIITNLDLHTIDLVRYQYGGTNLTGVRLINPDNEHLQLVTKKIRHMAVENGREMDFFSWKMNTSMALLVDAVDLFFEAIKDLVNSEDRLRLLASDVCCGDNWNRGYTIINAMKKKSIYGLTGPILFDSEGFRKEFILEIIELTTDGLNKVGEWQSSFGLKINRKHTDTDAHDEEDKLFNKNFKVITCINAPYTMLTETTVSQVGNSRFEGFCIDLIAKIAEIVGFNYTFITQEDCTNGNYNEATGEWNGMIRKILDGVADFAITDLTITADRIRYVDFTEPFMYLGISILYKKPEPVPPSMFMFTSPFSVSVWLMLGVAYLVVSLLLFIMGRLSKSEWTNPYPCIEEPEYLVNQFSFKNSLWFTVGSLMQQGSEIAPVGISTRTAAGVWWFFILIMVSSYTANLAAFLTVETYITPFKDIHELAAQNDIKYGAKSGGSTAIYFQKSNETTHKKIWKFMMDHKDEVMTNDNKQGIERVKKGNYAFFMESSSIEYTTERECDLAKVGGNLDEKGYGIAMKKNSSYLDKMSTALLQLQEGGVLAALKVKWWNEKRGGGKCSVKKESEATALDLQDIGGVFLVVSVGTFFGLIGSFMEFAICIHRRTKKSNLSFKQELFNELRFLIKIRQNIKPVRSVDNLSENILE